MAEPGITQTETLKLNKPDKGYFDWDVPLNENWDKLDFLGAGQLPLLYRMESERILEGAEATGWALQGSVLDGDTYSTVWTLLKTAKDRAASKTLEIKEITYTVAQDEVTGLVFVDQANYDKGWTNLKDSLGFVLTNVDEVKSITLPKRAVYDRADVESLNGFGVESLPNITGGVLYRGMGAQLSQIETEDRNIGALYKDTSLATSMDYGTASGSTSSAGGIGFDASRSSPSYQDGASVQPDHHVVYAYYKVGNTIVNSAEIDVGNLLTQVTGLETNKADIDLGNVTDAAMSFKTISARWIVPNYNKKIEKTTSPATINFDGICYFSAAGGTVDGIAVPGLVALVKEGSTITFSGTLTLIAFSYQSNLPDFSSTAVGAPYTATADGWLKFRLNRPDSWGTAYAYIDGVVVYSYYGRATTSGYQKIAIKAGQVYTTGAVYSNPAENTIFYNYDF